MKITKFEHSGISIEENGKLLLIDPVEFNNKLPEFANVAAIVTTHKHSDHCNPEIIAKIKAANPSAQIFTTVDAMPSLPGAIAVEAGNIQDVEGFHLEFFSKDHACIFEGRVPCSNIGVLVNGILAHPGDSFDLPPSDPTILMAPLGGPWCKVQETVNYIEQVRPQIVIPIHDAVLSDLGKTFNLNNVKSITDQIGIQVIDLKPNDDFTI